MMSLLAKLWLGCCMLWHWPATETTLMLQPHSHYGNTFSFVMCSAFGPAPTRNARSSMTGIVTVQNRGCLVNSTGRPDWSAPVGHGSWMSFFVGPVARSIMVV